MKKSILVLSIIPIISYLLSGCNPMYQTSPNVEPTPIPTRTSLPEPTSTETLTPTTVPTTTLVAVTKEISDKDVHLKLPSGLSIDAYALNNLSVEPLMFSPASDYSQAEIMAIHEEERNQLFPRNRIDEDNIKIQFGEHKLKTRKTYFTYPTPQPGSLGTIAIEVLLDDEVIYTAEGGKGNTTFDHLRGLWSYDDHWVLEYVYVTVTVDPKRGAVDNVIGQVVRDGVLLNEEYSYDEVFGFQLMKRKPFYFYKENGQIGITYDAQEFMLGFEEIHRYGCCSSAQLNPRQSQNMISFFARKSKTWYYVEIGVYE